MRILFSWFDVKSIEKSAAHLSAQPLLNNISQWSQFFPYNKLLNQVYIDKMYVFCAGDIVYEEQFKQWTRPDIVLIKVSHDGDGNINKLEEQIFNKIKHYTKDFKKDFGIIDDGSDVSEKILRKIANEKHVPCYSIKDKRLQEEAPEKKGGFISALKPEPFTDVIASSSSMAALIEKANKTMKYHTPVMITGEMGTGKKCLAKIIASGNNRNIEIVNFLTSSCDGFNKMFFGYRSNNGVLKKADGGTLILDNIDKCDLLVQQSLFILLSSMKKDTFEFTPIGTHKTEKATMRIVSTATCDVYEMVKEGKFLSELFYLMAPIILQVPPLRSRGDDVVLLAHNLLLHQNEEKRRNASDCDFSFLSTSAYKTLKHHRWTGNIQELKQVISQAVLFSDDSLIQANDLSITPKISNAKIIGKQPLQKNFDLQEEINEIQAAYILRALKETSNNISQAAKLLGLKSYQALISKMKSLKIEI